MGGFRKVVRATSIAIAVLAALAGSVQAVTMLSSMPSASSLNRGVRGYPGVGGGAYAGAEHVAAGILSQDSADRESLVFALGEKYAGTYGASRGDGFIFAGTIACENGDIVEHDIFSGDAAYTVKGLSNATITGSKPDTYSYRVPNCDNPDWDNEVDSDGKLGSDVTVNLTGQGKRNPILESEHDSSFPACAWGDGDAGFYRDAAPTLEFPNAGDAGFDVSSLKPEDGVIVVDGGAGAEADVGDCFGFNTGALRSHRRSAHLRVARAFAHRFARTH